MKLAKVFQKVSESSRYTDGLEIAWLSTVVHAKICQESLDYLGDVTKVRYKDGVETIVEADRFARLDKNIARVRDTFSDSLKRRYLRFQQDLWNEQEKIPTPTTGSWANSLLHLLVGLHYGVAPF